MKKEDFLKLGLDEEKAEQCEKESLAELRQFIPKTRFDEVNNDKIRKRSGNQRCTTRRT